MDKNVKDFNIRLRTIKLRELAIGVIITFIVTGILILIFPEIGESNSVFFNIICVIGGLLFLFALRGTTGIDKNIKSLLEKNTRKEAIYVFIINFLAASAFACIISLIDIYIGYYDPSWISVWDVDSANMTPALFIIDTIGTIILAPIIEELVFRGVLFNRLKIRTGIIPAMIISSIVFAMGHEFGGITSAFLFGICMCILYLKTDNILIPMFIHFLNNILATIFEITQIDLILSQIPLIIPFTIISVVGAVFLIIYIIREVKKLKTEYS
ncbi:MAG: CPBP family intramembrane metalloprotease [Methanobrevibacter thaueri]|nr:CPBP family intramembrane metalloprotease [Methanobrevibacter thaueri]